MRDTIKLAVRLMIFTLISGLALAGVNALTEGPIREQAIAKSNVAREAVLAAADAFEPYAPIDSKTYPDVDEVFAGLADGEIVGYTYLVSPYGYKGDIVMTLGVNLDGSINALAVNSQSETAGLGSLVAGDAFLSQFPGLAANPETIAGDIDAISGATISSKAVMEGVRQATLFSQDEMGISGAANESLKGVKVSPEDEQYAAQIGAKSVRTVSPYETLGYPAIESVRLAQMKGGSAYVFTLSVSSKDVIRSTLIIGLDGVIRSLTVDEQHEGEGYGSRIAEEPFTGQFAGKQATSALAEEIDALTGATSTFTNFMPGIEQAIDYYGKYLSEEVTP